MRDKTGYIYKIASPSGKIYIGSTNDLNRRFKEYKYLKCKEQLKIYNSLNKYGFYNHTIEVIEEPTLDTMLQREAYWGNYYNTLNRECGLNLSQPKYGDTYKRFSDETREKISNSHKGKVHSEETKLKMSNAHKGKVLSAETRLKMSESNKTSKIVLDTMTGIYYESLTEASKVVGYSQSHLSAMLTGVKINKTNLKYV